MAGFGPLNTARELAKFRRVRRILRAWGHDLRACPAESPNFAERGRYYAVCGEDGHLSVRIDLDDALLQIGDPSATRFDVEFFLALYSQQLSGVFERCNDRPGMWRIRPEVA